MSTVTMPVIRQWPIAPEKPRLTERQQEAVQLLRKADAEGVPVCYAQSSYETARCAIGLLSENSVHTYTYATERFGLKARVGGLPILAQDFDHYRWTFAQAADALEREPERYFVSD